MSPFGLVDSEVASLADWLEATSFPKRPLRTMATDEQKQGLFAKSKDSSGQISLPNDEQSLTATKLYMNSTDSSGLQTTTSQQTDATSGVPPQTRVRQMLNETREDIDCHRAAAARLERYIVRCMRLHGEVPKMHIYRARLQSMQQSIKAEEQQDAQNVKLANHAVTPKVSRKWQHKRFKLAIRARCPK